MGNPTSTTSNSAANLSRCLSPSCRRTRRTTVATRLSTSAAVSERPITMLASASSPKPRTSTMRQSTASSSASPTETLADDDEERYKSQFQGYIDDEIEADGLEELYTEAHKAIREDPFKKVDDAGEKKTKEEWKKEALKFKGRKLTKEEKVERVKAKIAELKE